MGKIIFCKVTVTFDHRPEVQMDKRQVGRIPLKVLLRDHIHKNVCDRQAAGNVLPLAMAETVWVEVTGSLI